MAVPKEEESDKECFYKFHFRLFLRRAAQLDILFFVHLIISRDVPIYDEVRKERKETKEEEKSPSPGGFRTHNLEFLLLRRLLYPCATTAAQYDSY